jgi:hypothetical protein
MARSRLALLLCLLLAALPAGARPRPRLAVLIVVDQLRAASVDRLEPLFGAGGLGGLGNRGAHLTLRYSFAVAETCPGHATLATGANPPVHGIASNRWWLAESTIYCVRDDRAKVLGAPEAEGRGPAQLRAGTLGDAWKAETLGQAKVIAVAGKDRSAILLGGHAADLALWYEPRLGRYTSSTAYTDELPPWVVRFNDGPVQESLANGTWSPLPAPAGLGYLLPPDDSEGEEPHLGGRTFPHHLKDLGQEEGRRDYLGTPQALQDTFALALEALEREELGKDAVPDLLLIGISALDYTGHWFGPLSLEATDLQRRLDLEVRKLREVLDARLGKDAYVLALTSDHGAADLPERTSRVGVPAQRVEVAALKEAAEAAVRDALPRAAQKRRVVGFHPPHIFLALSDLSEADRSLALDAVSARLEALEGIAAVYRPDQPDPPSDPFMGRLRQSMAAGRGGDLLIRQAPRVLFDFGPGTGADHGTAYAYDTDVPLFVMGPGVRRGRYAQRGDPRDVAPTLAYLVRGPPPDASEGRPLHFILLRSLRER